jgi:streptomycin 6-kinase
LRIPRGLEWWRDEPGGAAWLERLPRLAAECADRWSLALGAPFEPAHISLVVPAQLPDGMEVVLKINFPKPESEHEADALAHWDGTGAAVLLAADPERRALVVERCRPGTELWDVADEEEANRVAGDLLRRLWRPLAPGHPFRPLDLEAARWAEELPGRWERFGRPFEPPLLDEAVSFLARVGPSQGEQVVLHQDFHGGNVLRAQREPWLAIDPKPLAGEREFDTASPLRDRRDELECEPNPARRVRRRLDALSEQLELDRERMRGWAVAHALAWGLEESGYDAVMLACARWFAEAR